MGSTETDHVSKETADKIVKALAQNDSHLLAESWLPAKDSKTATAKTATKTSQQPIELASAPAPAGKSSAQGADPNQTAFRQEVATADKVIQASINKNILDSQKPGAKIGDVLKNFDALAQQVSQVMPGVAADFNTIKADPSKKADAANEAVLLHARGQILAEKAMVAYDAAFGPNADSGTPNRKQLIQIARQSMADASQDKDLPRQFTERYQAYEGRVAAYKLAPAIGAAESAPQTADGRVPAEKQPNAAAQADKRPDAPQGQQNPTITDQDLAAFVNAAKAAEPAKQALEQKIFGDPNVQANRDKYLTAKSDISYIANQMTGYTQEQRDDFQAYLFGTNNSVKDKQKYIDTFASKDKNLHDVATELLQVGTDKLPLLAQWYVADSANSNACNAFYEKAIAADTAGNQQQAATYWKNAQNYPLESSFLSDALQIPSVRALDAKMTADSGSLSPGNERWQRLFQLGAQAAQAGDPASAAKLYNESVQAADLLNKGAGDKAQKQLADAQQKGRTGDSLNADDQAAADVLRGPSLSRLMAAQGLNDIAARYKAEADKDPKDAAAYKQNATILNQQAVALLQEIPKVDPTYGGLTGADLTLFKQTVSDGIASAQKGEVINPDASKAKFLKDSVNGAVSDDAKLLNLATIGPHPATATAVMGYDAIQGAFSKIPVVGSFLPAIPFLPSPDAAQKQITADLRDAKAADPEAAKKAIDEHSTDLKSTAVNGLSTLVSAIAGPKLAKISIDALPGLAEKYLPEALQKAAPELPGWAKPAAYVAGGLLATVGTNEALQKTAQETLHTKMDSQGKILSESAAAYAAVALANKIPVGGSAKLDPVKFSGVWGSSKGAFAIRAGAGFVPGAGVGLYTHGPWNIDPNTGKPYTLGKTAASMALDGGVTSVAAMLGPTIAQPVTNAARGLWGAKNTILAAGAVNTVFGAGDTNPTQINPATGKHYTLAETGLAGAENFGTGMAGGLAASKFLPWAGKFAATPFSWAAKGGQWLANKEAGTVTAEATEAAQKAAAAAAAKGPGLLQKTGTKAIEIVNAPLTSHSKQIALGSIGLGNAAVGAISVNPSEINPATGQRYTVAETAETALENFGIGAGAGYAGMRALNLSGQLVGKVGDIPVVQRAGSAIGGTLERIKAGTVGKVAAVQDGANSVRRYLGEHVEGAVNYTQKHAIVQKITPAATTVTETAGKVTPIAPLVAAPVINKFLAPGSEYLRWKSADNASNEPDSTQPASH
jgi:hypothetical protein